MCEEKEGSSVAITCTGFLIVRCAEENGQITQEARFKMAERIKLMVPDNASFTLARNKMNAFSFLKKSVGRFAYWASTRFFSPNV